MFLLVTVVSVVAAALVFVYRKWPARPTWKETEEEKPIRAEFRRLSSLECQVIRAVMISVDQPCAICRSWTNQVGGTTVDDHIYMVFHCDHPDCVRLARDHVLWYRLQLKQCSLVESHPFTKALRGDVSVRSTGETESGWSILFPQVRFNADHPAVFVPMINKSIGMMRGVTLSDLFMANGAKLPRPDRSMLPPLPQIVTQADDARSIATYEAIALLVDQAAAS